MRLNEDVLATGFDNGAGAIVEPDVLRERIDARDVRLESSRAPKEVQDIFKRVAGGKLLGPHVPRS